MLTPHTRSSRPRESRFSDPQPTSPGGYAQRTLLILKATSGRSTSPLNRRQRGKRSRSVALCGHRGEAGRHPKSCIFFLESTCPRDAQRAVPSAEVASQARSILSLFYDKGSEIAL